MSMMVVEVYEALKAAGAPEDKAVRAAEAVAESQTASKSDIARLEKRLIRIEILLAIVLTAVAIPLLRSALTA